MPAPRERDRAAAVTSAEFAELRQRALHARRGEDAGWTARRLRPALAPAILLAGLLGLWEVLAQTGVLADVFGIEDFLVPAQAEIGQALWEDHSLLADDAWVTLKEVVLSFELAVVSGVGFAVLIHLSETARRAIACRCWSPAIPIVILAPILVVVFGFEIQTKLAIVAILCFFPITVNTLDGLRSVDPELLKLMRTMGTSRLQTLKRVEGPWALPYAFSGAKVAVAVSVIGAVFAEAAGSNAGLGHLIDQANAQLLTRSLVRGDGGALGDRDLALFALLTLLERRVVTWRGGAVRARVALATAALLAAVALASCGEKQETLGSARPRPFDLALDYVNPDRGIFTAIDNGYFERVGLAEFPAGVPSDPSAPIKEVAAGRADLAISYQPEVLLARDQGLEVEAVGAIVDQPLPSRLAPGRGSPPRRT